MAAKAEGLLSVLFLVRHKPAPEAFDKEGGFALHDWFLGFLT